MKINKLLLLAGSAVLAQIALSTPLLAQTNEATDNITLVSHYGEELPIANFQTIQTGTSGKAIIFIGGAGDTYHYWDKHINELTCKNVTVLGYEGQSGKSSQPFNSDYLEDNANLIANGILDLNTHGYKDIQWVAHSLGGVASLKATHILDNHIEELRDININLVAVNSPIGGYSAATPALYTPLFGPISKSMNIAMAKDMSPSSDFYQSISEKTLGNIKTTLIESKEDKVAQPETLTEIERYRLVSNTFDKKLTIGGDHVISKDPKLLAKYNLDLSNSETSTVLSNIKSIRDKHLVDSQKIFKLSKI